MLLFLQCPERQCSFVVFSRYTHANKKKATPSKRLCIKYLQTWTCYDTKLYIVVHILYDFHLYECILLAFCACSKEAWGCTTPPLVECIAYCSTSWCSNPGNLAVWKAYDHVPTVQIIPGMVDRRWIGTQKASQGVWHDQLANSSLPYFRYAGIVLLEEKIVSNSLIDWHDMRV